MPLISRSQLFPRLNEQLETAAVRRYEAVLSRRLTREPAAYILGHREFYGLDFLVTPATLIPRPETELLVEVAIEVCTRQPGWHSPVIGDIGTGSGAIAVALAKSFPRAMLFATDVSSGALAVARQNADRHGVERRIAFRRGDLLEPIDMPLDLIVANLPYVNTGDMPGLEPEVRDHEPAIALTAGADGLDLIRPLLRQSLRYLRPGGAICLEYGYGQTTALLSLARSCFPGAQIQVKPDLAGIDRVMTILPG